jgi:polysaccharide biosynthesis/export protein
MKSLLRTTVVCFLIGSAFAQSPASLSSSPAPGFQTSNLPMMHIGPEDLISVQVYDSPELTRTVRVNADGTIRMPMLKQKIKVDGMMPAEIETAISKQLQTEGILVDPVVTVSIAEYLSKPISVAGEVKIPGSFQAQPNMTLLDAIIRAGGLTDEAGQDIIVTRIVKGPDGTTQQINQRIPAKDLLDATDHALNLALTGGEQISVPPAGRIYVVGNVKSPGAVKVHETNDATVFKVLAITQGTLPFSQKVAYIYRKEAGQAGQDGIPIQLADILQRKAPDVPLQSNDILYIPENSRQKLTVDILKASLGIATTVAVALLYVYK